MVSITRIAFLLTIGAVEPQENPHDHSLFLFDWPATSANGAA